MFFFLLPLLYLAIISLLHHQLTSLHSWILFQYVLWVGLVKLLELVSYSLKRIAFHAYKQSIIIFSYWFSQNQQQYRIILLIISSYPVIFSPSSQRYWIYILLYILEEYYDKIIIKDVIIPAVAGENCTKRTLEVGFDRMILNRWFNDCWRHLSLLKPSIFYHHSCWYYHLQSLHWLCPLLVNSLLVIFPVNW